ncbi:MAG: Trk family potassium uptake protein [Ruminococcaceae bacterium]|nr:Trk family potassium uptake protein [Oscillospiraceae bacterium]
MKRIFKESHPILRLSFTKVVFLGFAILVFAGALLLMLPFATVSGESTTFLGALFTSTSATCVTGLVVYDTGTHWTAFGKAVILLLIQIGGLGFVTIVSLFFLMIKRDVGLRQRMMIMQSTGALEMGGIMPYIKRIAKGTFLCEGIGALLLSTRFIPRLGLVKGILYSVFHAVSAFCNAGFDLNGEFNSFVDYKNDAVVNITLVALIVIGGLGFLVWSDLLKNKLRFKKYRLHTKIVLVSSLILIFGGAFLFFILEKNASLNGLSLYEKILASVFQSVTMRTAGFNTVDLGNLSNGGSLCCVLLMFVGGSPGSTAGGMKTTTVSILVLAAIASARRKKDVTVYGRRLEQNDVLTATAVGTLYIMMAFFAVVVISAIEPFSMKEILFEVASAENTVGVTMNLTRSFGVFSQILLMALMFIGRIGGLTLALLFLEEADAPPVLSPVEKILVG